MSPMLWSYRGFLDNWPNASMSDKPIQIDWGTGDPQSCVIWLHGLGADGHDFEPIVNELGLPASLSIRFVFPHAPMRAVTINNGFVMRAWYDVLALDIASRADEEGIRESQQYLEGLIEEQIDAGTDSRKIVLAGFSQGGAVVLQTGLRYSKPLAGLMALSTYLPLEQSLSAEKTGENAAVPIFLAHGDSDPVVAPELAYRSRSKLEQQGYAIEWREYAGLQHGVNMDELRDIRQWLIKVLE